MHELQNLNIHGILAQSRKKKIEVFKLITFFLFLVADVFYNPLNDEEDLKPAFRQDLQSWNSDRYSLERLIDMYI